MLTAEFELPTPLRTVARIAEQFEAAGIGSKLEFYDELFGLSADWSSPIDQLLNNRIYPTTPPELIVIGDFGVDGAHAGIIVHGPELNQIDYPIGCYCEIDAEGVRAGGTDSLDFIKMRISMCLECWNSGDADRGKFKHNLFMPYVELIGNQLGFSPSPNFNIVGWGGSYVKVSAPPIPPGYRYIPTSDHIGVLAKQEMFDPDYSSDLTAKDCIRKSKMFRRRGFPATALHVLKQNAREIYFHTNSRRTYSKLLNEMAQVYDALGRPLLAKAVLYTRSNVC